MNLFVRSSVGVLSAAITATGALMLSAPSASAAPTDVDARTLSRGAKPAVDQMYGTWIQPRNGAAFRAKLPAGNGNLALLGRGKRGYVVSYQGYFGRLFTVRGPSAVTEFHRFNMGGGDWQGLLNPAGNTVGIISNDRTNNNLSLVRTDGKKVGERSDFGWRDGLETSRDSIVLDGEANTVRWTPGSGIAKIASGNSTFADIPSNTLFRSTGRNTSGPTALDAPAKPRWSAQFQAQAVTKDGSRVAGYDPTQPRVLQIRSLSTGKVLASFRSATGVDRSTMTFEGNGPLLWEARTKKGSALVRCRVSTMCRRATPFRDSDISVPRER